MPMAVPINRQREAAADPSLPHNLEAERAILGAILLENSAFDKAFQKITADDFFLPQHRYIARAMKSLKESQSPIDTTLLMHELAKTEHLDAAGGAPYLSQLADGLPRSTNVEHYAGIVFEQAVRRYTIYEAQTIARNAADPSIDHAAQLPADKIAELQSMRMRIEAQRAARAGRNGAKWKYTAMEFLSAELPEPEQLIEGMIARSGTAMFVAMPHHLKSWFVLSVAMGATKAGTLLGKLIVPRDVRTLYFAVEDNPGDVRKRMRNLIYSKTFPDWDPKALALWTRPPGGFDIMDEGDFQELLGGIAEHKADLLVIDVMRRIFRGDINSPKESGALCEQFDRLRDSTGAAIAVVHHENRKGEDIMRAGAGSFNFAGWADVMIQLKRKIETGTISRVEVQADYQLGRGIEPMSLILDLSSEVALRMESLEDLENVAELREGLGQEWTVRDLAEFLEVHRSNATRRLKKLRSAGLVEKVKAGKRGRISGQARWSFVGDTSSEE